jgi:hypothetical protein
MLLFLHKLLCINACDMHSDVVHSTLSIFGSAQYLCNAALFTTPVHSLKYVRKVFSLEFAFRDFSLESAHLGDGVQEVGVSANFYSCNLRQKKSCTVLNLE